MRTRRLRQQKYPAAGTKLLPAEHWTGKSRYDTEAPGTGDPSLTSILSDLYYVGKTILWQMIGPAELFKLEQHLPDVSPNLPEPLSRGTSRVSPPINGTHIAKRLPCLGMAL